VVPAWGQKAKRDLGEQCIYYEVRCRTPSRRRLERHHPYMPLCRVLPALYEMIRS
jgi:hypothetical protein